MRRSSSSALARLKQRHITWLSGPLSATLLLFIALVSPLSLAAIQFEDTSEQLGFTRGTETWGIAWGNITGDKYPDLYNPGHRDFPRIYFNNGRGGFDDVTNIYDNLLNNWHLNFTQRDEHGVAMADYDNDGDDDILVGDDGGFFINHVPAGGALELIVDKKGAIRFAAFDNTPPSRDLFSVDPCVAGTNRPAFILLFDLDVDGDKDRFCVEEGTFPRSPNPLIPNVNLVNDIAIGDFNNDGRTDLVATRGNLRPAGAARVNNRRIEAWFRSGTGTSFTFQSNGPVEFIVDGAGGGIFRQPDVVMMDTSQSASQTRRGVRMSYNTGSATWTVEDVGNSQAYVRVNAVNPVTQPVESFAASGDLAATTYHGINTSSGVNWVFNTGLSAPRSCASVVAADFDNDMDLDLYMVCRSGVRNLANKYFDNQGNGSFVEVTNFGGEGPVGAGIEVGVGASAATADYDLDGFIDVAVTNGLLYYPVSLGGPDTLLRNRGNNNRWIHIDLNGTTSNRSAIGAKVYLTVAGVTQLREQSNGYHRWTQNHNRIHFGLANNNVVDEIRIEWPSGQVDTHTNVAANRLYDAVEGGALTQASVNVPPRIQVEAGDECGKPAYTSELGPAVLIWRDCGTSNWHLQAHSGLGRLIEERNVQVTGQLLGDSNFQSANLAGASGNDTFSRNGDRLDFELNIKDGSGGNTTLNFNTGSQTHTCLLMTQQDPELLLIGSAGKRLSLPFDLSGLGTCDTDGDGVIDYFDAFPLDPTRSGNDRAPVANNLSAMTTINTPVTISLTATDADNDPLSYSIVSSPNHGLLSGTLPNLTFTPDAGFTGTDSFTFRASDGTNLSNVATVTLNVGAVTGGVFCGEPSFNSLTERGTFLWRNCTTNQWSLRVTGGGSVAGLTYEAQLRGNGGLSNLQEILIEPNDTLDQSQVDTLRYALRVFNNGIDGIDFTAPANTCFTPSSPNLPVWLGAGKVVLSSENLNLSTAGPCPAQQDTDGDGLSDDQEATLGTDPTLADTDGGGVNDGDEVANGTDPLNPSDDANPTGDACGEPAFSPSAEHALFAWKDCQFGGPDARWRFRVSGGSQSFDAFEGTLTVDTVVTASGVSLEASDTLDSMPGDGIVDFTLFVGGNGVDGFDIDVPAGANSCLNVSNLPGAANIRLGINQVPATSPLRLQDLGPCDVDNTCGAPTYNPATEPGVYLWKDCGATEANWNVRVVAGGLGFSAFSGLLRANTGLQADGFSLEGSDVLDTAPGDNTIDFVLRVGGNGQDGFTTTLPVGTNSCFELTAAPAGVGVFVGPTRQPVSGAFNLENLGVCQ